MSGIPGTFVRDNGQAFWGGYENMTDLHYADGWRDEAVPEYDPRTQQLGVPYYDPVLDIVAYPVVDRVVDLENARAEKIQQAKEQANRLLSQTDWYVVRYAETGEPVPAGIASARQAIRARCNAIEAAISALTNARDVLTYQIDI